MCDQAGSAPVAATTWMPTFSIRSSEEGERRPLRILGPMTAVVQQQAQRLTFSYTLARISLWVLVLFSCFGFTAALETGLPVTWGDRSIPPFDLIDPVNPIIAVSAGNAHTVVLKQDGSVIAWGDNSQQQTSVPGNLSLVTAISAGAYHNLALKSDGTVVAWGANSFGQSTVPSNLTGVRAIAAGNNFSMALKSDGAVIAWGWDFYGVPTFASSLTGIIAIAAGDSHALALRSDGTVVTWGLSSNGLGIIPPALAGVTAIAAGQLHSVALISDGTVVAWGSNTQGQTTIPAGLSGVISIAAVLPVPDPELETFLKSLTTAWQTGEVRPTHRERPQAARNYRTRVDDFEVAWPLVTRWLEAEPDRTAQELFLRLQADQPGAWRYGQVRTLQRRVHEWRTAEARRLILASPNQVRLGPSDVAAVGSNIP